VVCRDAVHVDGLLGDAAKEIASANDDSDLATGTGHFGNFVGDCADEDSINTETSACGQGFSGQLKKNALVHAF